jgi:hypothetical protein
MKKIVNYSKFEAKSSYKFLGKEELDKLNNSEVMKCREDVLTYSKYPMTSDEKQYIEEIELYYDIRFKDEFYARFDRYRNDVKNNKGDKNDIETKKLLTSVPTDAMYKIHIEGDLKKIGEFKFIKGIEIPDFNG